MDTPASLLERLRGPTDPASWERFVNLYTPLLFHWVRRLGVTDPAAADLVQDVFAILVEKLPGFRYDPARRFRGWLWTVVRNRANTLRRQARHRREIADEQAVDAACVDTPTLDDVEYQQYLVRRALNLMQTEFEANTWKAFWECVAHERTAADVGRELGLSVDSVYAAKSRVLRRLRRGLDGLLD
jgi:RNA polymerase sigma-70 factor (ECF subfamily)